MSEEVVRHICNWCMKLMELGIQVEEVLPVGQSAVPAGYIYKCPRCWAYDYVKVLEYKGERGDWGNWYHYHCRICRYASNVLMDER